VRERGGRGGEGRERGGGERRERDGHHCKKNSIFYWATLQFGDVWGQEHKCKIICLYNEV